MKVEAGIRVMHLKAKEPQVGKHTPRSWGGLEQLPRLLGLTSLMAAVGAAPGRPSWKDPQTPDSLPKSHSVSQHQKGCLSAGEHDSSTALCKEPSARTFPLAGLSVQLHWLASNGARHLNSDRAGLVAGARWAVMQEGVN